MWQRGENSKPAAELYSSARRRRRQKSIGSRAHVSYTAGLARACGSMAEGEASTQRGRAFWLVLSLSFAGIEGKSRIKRERERNAAIARGQYHHEKSARARVRSLYLARERAHKDNALAAEISRARNFEMYTHVYRHFYFALFLVFFAPFLQEYIFMFSSGILVFFV